jgi:hypothetical protein
MTKKRRLLILGAGCSYAAGLPDGDRLPGHLFGYVGGAPWEIVYNKPPGAYWAPLYGALHGVLGELADGGPQSRWALDRVFDRFHEAVRADPMGFAPTYGLLFEATAQLLYTRSCQGGTTDVYRNFVDALEPNDIILTFNWDACPEIAFHESGRPFSRQLGPDIPDSLPWLLKLHGSIDYLIVESTFSVKNEKGRAAFLESLGVEAPSPFPGKHFQLTRLRTYDLGYEVQLEPAAQRDRETATMPGVVGGFDVGPFWLTHFLKEYPTFHMLTPGSPELLYDWQYNLTLKTLRRVCPDIDEIIVAGYSFPAYDKPVHRVLHTLHGWAGKPTTHIVNPAAATLSPKLLKSIFGKCELHGCGFGEYEWRRKPGPRSRKKVTKTSRTGTRKQMSVSSYDLTFNYPDDRDRKK